MKKNFFIKSVAKVLYAIFYKKSIYLLKKGLTFSRKGAIIREQLKTQVSPSGMAAASQAVPGEFDSRHLLQKEKRTDWVRFSFWKIKCD